MSSMKLSRKLTIIFLAIGILPILLLSAYFTYTTNQSLSNQAFNQLESVRSIKKNQIQAYFNEREGDAVMLSEMISSLFTSGFSLSEVEKMLGEESTSASYFKKFIDTYGYYALFLINPEGLVHYSVTQESDYMTNLNTGPYRDSGLAKVFRSVKETQKYKMQDFEPYSPSNNEPAGFIAYPISHQGELITVIALQLSIERINAIMQQREGMGDTGESYLVGPDKLMRSDSFLDPDGHSVLASFAGNVTENGIDSVSVNRALADKEGITELIDYNGNPVLSAFAPVNIGSLRWSLIAEVDVAEALAPVAALKQTVLITVLIITALVIALGIWVSLSITRPLGGEPIEMKEVADTIASGNLSVALNSTSQHASAFNSMRTMVDNLRQMVKDISAISADVAKSSEATSVITTQTHSNTQQQQTELTSISSAMVEMVATVQEIASNALNASDATAHAAKEIDTAQQVIQQTMASVTELSEGVNHSNATILDLEEYSTQIDSILAVIVGIAEQTNLLALNAAIEAARAGDHGRGFAVVADEVRSLAQRTQDSTSDIEAIISQLKGGTRKASHSMDSCIQKTHQTLQCAKEMDSVIESIGKGADQINEMMLQIASATEEQSCVADEIGRNVEHINQLAVQNSKGVGETANATQYLSESAGNLHRLIANFKT